MSRLMILCHLYQPHSPVLPSESRIQSQSDEGYLADGDADRTRGTVDSMLSTLYVSPTLGV